MADLVQMCSTGCEVSVAVITKRTVGKAGRDILYGAVIGSSMLIPGVSGGTTAIILGIYDRLISAVSNITKEPKKQLPFLGLVALGGIAGAVLFSGAVLSITETFPVESMHFFIGAILGSIPLLVKKSGITVSNLYNIVFALIGIFAVFGIRLLPQGSSGSGWFMLIISGMVIAAAMVLPGISTSHILLVLGMYESVWGGLRSIDIDYLFPIGIGGIIGTLLTAKLTDKAMECFPCQTYMVIIGFVMTSVYDIFPHDTELSRLPVCILLCAAGFAAVLGISNFADRK